MARVHSDRGCSFVFHPARWPYDQRRTDHKKKPMSASLTYAEAPAPHLLGRMRDTLARAAADRAAPAKPADPITLFTTAELREMVLDLMG